MKELPRKTGMTLDLFQVGDVVTPSCGHLRGLEGKVVDIDRFVTIQFPKPVRKYPDEPTKPALDAWRYEASNVRLVAFPARKLRTKKD